MYGFVLALHILVSIVLILIVLFQQPQKGGMGTVFGGGETLFGGAGAAPFLTKLTTGLAIVFVITSLSLVLLSVHRAPAPGRGQSAPTAPAQGGAPQAPTGPEQNAPAGPAAPAQGGNGQGGQ
jgi:preprotein translocase subunit SecG